MTFKMAYTRYMLGIFHQYVWYIFIFRISWAAYISVWLQP